MPRKFFALLALPLIFALPNTVYAQTPTPIESTASPTASQKFRVGPTLKQSFKDRLKVDKSRQEAASEYLEQKKQLYKQGKEALEIKLKNFKDLRRKSIVLKLDEKMASISSKRTDRMSEALDKLEDILNRVKNNADTITGCDKNDLNSAIASAETALASASAAVEAQAEKLYNFNIENEESARTNVGASIKLLTQDLRAAHHQVMNAKQTVVKTAIELRKLKSCVKKTDSSQSSQSAQPTTPIASPSVTLSPTSM